MKSLKKTIGNFRILLANVFKKSETIIDAKLKWNDLARKNARYYVLTDKGESITEAEFREAGKRDVEVHVLSDKLMMNCLEPTSEKVVLEIGCGVGRLSEFLAPHFKKLYGVDISEEMINKARERLSAVANTEFLATDGMSFPIDSNTIDLAFSFIVFQHMPSKEIIRKNVEGISRVLRTGGLAKIQLRGIPVSKNKWYYGPSFTGEEARGLIDGLPLEILKIEGEGHKYLWVWMKKV